MSGDANYFRIKDEGTTEEIITTTEKKSNKTVIIVVIVIIIVVGIGIGLYFLLGNKNDEMTGGGKKEEETGELTKEELGKLKDNDCDIIQFVINGTKLKSDKAVNHKELVERYSKSIGFTDIKTGISSKYNVIYNDELMIHRGNFNVEIWNPKEYNVAKSDYLNYATIAAIIRGRTTYKSSKYVINKMFEDNKFEKIISHFFK